MPASAQLPPPRQAGALYRLIFVCTGNICRSPMAAVVLKQLAAETPVEDGSTLDRRLEVTSAGTGNWHVGEPMDRRARKALAAAGYGDGGHVAAHVKASQLGRFDLIVGLDRSHVEILRGLARPRASAGSGRRAEAIPATDPATDPTPTATATATPGTDREPPRSRLVLLRPFDPAAGGEVDVPDPYYGDQSDFARCLHQIEAACRGLATALADIVSEAAR